MDKRARLTMLAAKSMGVAYPLHMSLADWRHASASDPRGAAREFLRRARERLPQGQVRAVFSWLRDEESLAEALAAAQAGSPLAGVPFVAKDLFGVAGVPTRAGSSFLHEVVAPPAVDARLVQAVRACGGVCAGKTHLHEFAYGLTGENPHYGDCDNPSHPGRTTGGSSSGSAAAVAAGIAPLALGTDTGGSVRLPAAFCGLYGIRGTPGHEWIADAFPLAPSCDTAGWFARTARDMREATAALAGLGASGRPLQGCHVALGRLDPGIAEAFEEAAALHAPPADAATRQELLRAFEGSAEAYTVLTSAEAAAVHAPWLDTLRSRYSPVVWQRIDRGRHWEPKALARAAIVREVLRSTLASFFMTYDFLILPAAPCLALRHEDCPGFDRTRILDLEAPASLAGLPVLTLPSPGAPGPGLQVIVNSLRSPAIAAALAVREAREE